MKSHMPRWPTGSPDPLVNILATGVLIIFGLLAFATSFFLLIPVAIGFAVIGLVRWYHYRPPAYSNPAIAAAAEQHALAANFPEIESFAESYARRLIDAWHPRLPVFPVFAGIVDAAVEIYAMEGFNNPIPPLPSDPIEQGRWRDELRIHAIKMHDAPKTLGLFTGALTRSLASFRDALPETVLVTKDEFVEWRDHQPPLTVPARELTGDIEQPCRGFPVSAL